MEMNIKKFALLSCIISDDFKEVKEGCYQALVKANQNDMESIILLEINKKHYNFLQSFDYKKININIKGEIQVRKNQKDIPFLFFKAIRIERSESKSIKNRRSKDEEIFQKFNWIKEIGKLECEVKELDSRNIKFINEKHIKRIQIDISRKVINKFLESSSENVKVAVRPIENTENYELLIGWRIMILSKLFDKNVKCYVVDKSREELVQELYSKINF